MKTAYFSARHRSAIQGTMTKIDGNYQFEPMTFGDLQTMIELNVRKMFKIPGHIQVSVVVMNVFDTEEER